MLTLELAVTVHVVNVVQNNKAVNGWWGQVKHYCIVKLFKLRKTHFPAIILQL